MSSIAQSSRELSAWQRFWQSRRNQRRVTLAFKTLLALIVIGFSLFPIIWTISAAFNPSSGISGQRLIPVNPTLRHFQEILVEHPFWTWLKNSLIVSSISAVLAGGITMLAAYSFSRFRFRGRNQLLLLILLIQVFPALLAMIALFALLLQIGQYIPLLGLNSLGGLILIYLGGAMGINVWLMKGFFDSIPRAIDESAMVDGATHWQIFWQLIFPLVRPIVVVVIILTFFGTFGDWLMPRIMIQRTELFTLMLGLQTFIGDNYGQNWGPFAAGALLGSIPQVIVFILLQDQIVGGLTAGSVKG
ncbi:MAG TPA: sugar ABC transporter permease [Anaerolineae bacterium]